jgi:hypothetical protein
VPVTFLNALAYLLPREAIPPQVIRHIFLYSLDTVGRHGRLGVGGTSSEAIRLLGHWLGRYRTRKFAVETEYLQGEQVHLARGSKIVACLRDGGVALCNICLGRRGWHYVLAVKARREWLLCFDPYWRLAVRGLRDHVRLPRSPNPRAPNLAVERAWIDARSDKRRFCFGAERHRECLLMWRKKP